MESTSGFSSQVMVDFWFLDQLMRDFLKLTMKRGAESKVASGGQLHAEAAPPEQHLRSRLFIYDLRDGSSRLLYCCLDMEGTQLVSDGKYLIATLAGAFTSSFRLA
jgi:hypothetical protein